MAIAPDKVNSDSINTTADNIAMTIQYTNDDNDTVTLILDVIPYDLFTATILLE